MTKAEAKKVIRSAFAALTKRQKANLGYHAEKGTGICCGEKAALFTNGSGGG